MTELGKISFQIFYADGTVRNRPAGHYWRLEIADGHFGEARGTYPTTDEAKTAAEDYIDKSIKNSIARLNQKSP